MNNAIIPDPTAETAVTEPRNPEFPPGAKVAVREEAIEAGHLYAGAEGTVVRHEDRDDGRYYRVRIVPFDREYETVPEHHLEPAEDAEFVDLDEPSHLVAAIRSAATATSKHLSLDAADRHVRIHTASRLAFLASRLAWLLAVEAQSEALAASFREAS